ncbi:MAG: carboxylating nicotinate-nucleotide diphosphorylase, partial [Candidatus Omnitrophica bacterium]|nr:carboxylating nicotinate-nucleotide diphosphorylase [Candidatus Omnitrophota bacterium]
MGLRISKDIKLLIKHALKEDIGRKDITTDFILSKDKKIDAIIICKEKEAVLCGLDIAREVFKTLDKNIIFKTKLKDGDILRKNKIVAYLKGKAKKILTAERVALNFLGLLSGISTSTYRFIEKVRPYNVKIMDTRKTLPGLRELEKYAVKVGGGYNHRLRLDEMILIKDNHLKVKGGINNLVKDFKILRRKLSKGIKIEIEVKNIEE